MKRIFVLFLLCLSMFSAADENFKWLLKDGRILLHVAEKCYLYASVLQIDAYDKNGKLVKINLPETVDYDDELMGSTAIIPEGSYSMEFASGKVASAKISYQGCKKATDKESGVCFMPQDITLGDLPQKKIGSVEKSTPADDFILLKKHEGTMSVEQMLVFLSDNENAAQSVSWWENKSMFFIFLLLLSGGLLLNFTPCVLPMIPINLAIIGAGGEKTVFAGFLRGVYYALGITCAYGALGMAVVLSGARFGELNSSMYFNFAVAVIFFALALAMGGVWNLDFSGRLNSINPMAWQIGRPFAIFFMGVTAALLAGACVAPAVIGMLVFALALYESSPAGGLAVPFIFGAGMGLLWIVAGATMGKILPKPGKWMVYVKNIMAIAIGCFGIYYAWTGFNLIPGRFNAEVECEKFYAALEQGERENKKVFVDFWASWCKNCSAMERTVLADEEVKEKLENFVVVKFQAEDLKNESVAEILKHYKIQGLPAFIILEKKK